MSDSEMADSEMISSSGSPASNYIPELNCLMRYNDDYLLLTTSKNNACLFIEKMKKLSEDSNFKLNMKKLKTNFNVNLQKIGCNFDSKKIETKLCNWVGLSIDIETL